VAKGFQDGKIEINLVTDITIFISGTWSRANENDKTIDVKITGGSTSGNLDGGGKIFLTDDRKSITGLKLQVVNKIPGRPSPLTSPRNNCVRTGSGPVASAWGGDATGSR
jgi:hypothetical protein